MSVNSGNESRNSRWVGFADHLGASVPTLRSWYDDTELFRELRLKARDDGTILAIAKGYDSAGGEVVCFGSGYDVASCLLSVDAAMQGGNWRVDAPWEPPGK